MAAITKTKKFTNRFQLLLIFVLILSTYPYVFDRFIPMPSMQIISVSIFVALILSALFFSQRSIKPLPLVFTVCLLLQIGVWLSYYFIHSDTSYFTRIFFLMLTYIVCFVIHNTYGFMNFMHKYNIWIALQATFGLIAFILVFVGLLSPILESELPDGRPVYFLGITCSNAYYGNLLRSAGFFDEPGALAFWGIYALVINKLFICSKRVEWFLIVGLLSTLSLAYFIQLSLYFVFFSIKQIKSSILLAVVVGLIAIFVYNQREESLIYELTYGRVENNILYGTNRDRMIEVAKQVYAENPVFGVGGSNMEKYDYMADNPYEILAKDGIVGMFVTYLPLIFLLLAKWRQRDILLSIVLLMVGYMQRPFHIGFLHYMMIYVFMIMGLIYNRKNE